MDIKMELGEKIRFLRKEKKMTLKNLSEITNISVSFLSDIENGRSMPSVDSLSLITRALGVTVSYVLSEEPAANEHKEELDNLLKDYNKWSSQDKSELLHYLRAKKSLRDNTIDE